MSSLSSYDKVQDLFKEERFQRFGFFAVKGVFLQLDWVPRLRLNFMDQITQRRKFKELLTCEDLSQVDGTLVEKGKDDVGTADAEEETKPIENQI